MGSAAVAALLAGGESWSCLGLAQIEPVSS